MIVCKITSGLGNQMFQYAFIKALSLRNDIDFKLDIFEYTTCFRPYELEIFDINRKYAKLNEIPFYERWKVKNKYLVYINNVFIKPFLRNLNGKHFKERKGVFEFEFMRKKEGYFSGYFQNEGYFKDFEDEIRKDFTFIKKISKKNMDIIEKFKNDNVVSVHVRRGDYLNDAKNFPLIPLEYYERSISHIRKVVDFPKFLFFSDDISRVKNNFHDRDFYFVDWNTGRNSWQDLALMSKCKHNIIANSSFSWWGARLNNNKNKIIIAPKKFSNDVNFWNKNIIPNDWLLF